MKVRRRGRGMRGRGVIMHCKIPLTLKKDERRLEGDKERRRQLE